MLMILICQCGWCLIGFSGASVFHLGGYSNTGTFTGVTALNGTVLTSSTGGAFEYRTGLGEANLIKDSLFLRRGSAVAYTFINSIIDRNLTTSPATIINTTSLVSGYANDVAMTVLPNAPIDADTGLPVPTIAVGTSTGLSIIKDDGTVINRSTSFVNSGDPGGVHDISFDNNNGYWYTNCHYPPTSGSTSHAAVLGHTSSIDITGALVSSDNQNYSELMLAIGSDDRGTTTHWSTSNMTGLWMNHGTGHSFEANAGYMEITPAGDFSNRFGLHKFLPNYDDHSKSAVAYITSDYNTGYMVGDIRLSALSDTDTANVGGSELVTNGTFASNTASWTAQAGATISRETTVFSGGGLKVLTNGTAGANAIQSVSGLTVGKTYAVSTRVYSPSSNTQTNLGSIGFATNDGQNRAKVSLENTIQTIGFTFVAGATSQNIMVMTLGSAWGSNGDYSVFDNISVRLADDDRSVTNNGLQTHGTITKSAVATGAELVGYSGFTTSNYLLQPYNAALNFTNEFSISFWVKNWSAGQDLLHRGPGQTRNSKTSFHMYCDGGYDYRLTLTSNGSSEQTFEIPLSGNLTGWQNVCFTLTPGGAVRGYLNGRLEFTGAFTGTNIFTQAADLNGLYIGDGPVSAAFGGSLALLRLSATAPTAEQIAKMYNDEKHLFQTNAKATLYGTSDAVTALAHDDDTRTLHAGTSAGRSDFQGLRRINNTTRAIGTAISAVDGFIVEE